MSWSGTVRCSHCYESGHNRRGCPQLQERMEKRLEENADDWRAQQYFEKKKGAKVRKCSFCKEQGHNRATCPNLKSAKSQWIESNGKFREEVLSHMKASGIGLGTLVSVPETYVGGSIGYVRNALGVVTAINWNSINIDSWDNYPPKALTVKTVGAANTSVQLFLPVDEGNQMRWDARQNLGLSAVKAPCSGSHTAPPSDWVSGEVSKEKIKDVFDGQTWGEEYNYDTREYMKDTCSALEKSKNWEAWFEKNKENE